MYSIFIGIWALNYARMPLNQTLELDYENVTSKELYELSYKLALQANELREHVATDAQGVYVTNSTFDEINNNTYKVFDEYAPEFMNLGGHTQVKGIGAKNFLSVLNITGIYCPFTFECNVNMEVPPLFFGSTTIHEYAHFKGFAREDEANFISYYIGRNSTDTDFAYSSTMLALNYTLNALHDVSKEAHAEIYDILSEGIKLDFNNENTYWNKFDTPLAEQSTQVNDTYLKSNRQSDGVLSYGRMVDLLIALMRKGEI